MVVVRENLKNKKGIYVTVWGEETGNGQLEEENGEAKEKNEGGRKVGNAEIELCEIK